MTTTKIPPALTKEERDDDAIEFWGCCSRLVVKDAASEKILKTGLTKRQTMEFVWLYDGREYEIKPRLGTLCDESGCNSGIKYQFVDIFGPEWDVYFKNGHDQSWRKSNITAYGETERDAILWLLDEGFKRQAWPSAFCIQEMGYNELSKQYKQLEPEAAKRIAVGS